MTKAIKTDDVYQAHKDRVAAINEKYTNGGIDYIEQLKDYAHTKISRDESAVMNCGTYNNIDVLCTHISAHDNIKSTRVYPGLRLIGFNHRYHEYKKGNGDTLYEISELTDRCYLSTDPFIIDYVSRDSLSFDGAKSVQYRVDDRTMGIAVTEAHNYGIKVSELNLYNVLIGINVLVSNEPYYKTIIDTPIIRPVIKTFDNINEILHNRLSSLNTIAPK